MESKTAGVCLLRVLCASVVSPLSSEIRHGDTEGTEEVSFEKWHGRPARGITRKMRVPPQTDPLPYAGMSSRIARGSSPSHSGFSAVPSKIDEVLKGSN